MNLMPAVTRILRTCLASALFWGCVAYPQTASLQSAQNTQNVPPRIDWTTAANRWRLTPAEASSEGDTVFPAVRAARNSYFLSLLSEIPNGLGILGQYDSNKPDVSTAAADSRLLWVVGTFESSRVYSADNSNRFLYTEIELRVETIIRKPNMSSPAVGSTINIYLLGGKLRTADGDVHASALSPERFSLEPGHRYILALAPEPDGLFVNVKDWDVTDGVVKASSEVDEARVRRGRSYLVGLSLAAAIEYIKKALSTE